MTYQVPETLLVETFEILRQCGQGYRECQALWVSAWQDPEAITRVVHPRHNANPVGFENDSAWVSAFWLELAEMGLGIRVQIHTHPGAAYHSGTDDAYPIIHQPGFLSLVIPNFASGPIGFSNTYLAEITADGGWRQAPITERLEIIP